VREGCILLQRLHPSAWHLYGHNGHRSIIELQKALVHLRESILLCHMPGKLGLPNAGRLGQPYTFYNFPNRVSMHKDQLSRSPKPCDVCTSYIVQYVCNCSIAQSRRIVSVDPKGQLQWLEACIQLTCCPGSRQDPELSKWWLLKLMWQK
jgi:hypothetical protein